ncbi:hypothetical protein MKW98_031298 [Papaver atlanticum]|uniref:RING-type E3 ubiquitin transferase n=1 Tax=Papaver atlanticum TaxID=357466 RepID=A0AAD4X7V1_9MAGN|nr:hypothetical protein MKW98_031298 [Papaver atlanticum]
MKPPKDFRINTNIVNSDFKYDEDEDVCRICRNPAESENPLKYPCACSGSIKFVHQDCLLQWLNYSNARRCEGSVRQDEDPVPSDDLVSMQLGPVFHLVKFAFTVLASNMKIIGAVIFLPFSIGRIILHIVQRFSTTSATGYDIVSRLSDTTILATGYMFIAPMVLFHLGVVAMVTYAKGEALNIGRLYVVAYIADSVSSLVRQYTAIMRRLMSMVRPVFLLLVELGVFPLICGWWLDVCTFRMLGKTLSLTVEFSSFSPWASSLMRWTAGIIYMLQFGIYTFGICDVGPQKLLTLKCFLLSVNY